MPGKIQAHNEVPAPLPLLFFIADTGGGHRNAARAVGQALDRLYPGRFAPVLADPLGGQGSARLLRWITAGYGPAIRLAPWLWGAAYHASNSRPAMRLLRGTLLRLADRPAVATVARHRPAALVSFHPLTGTSAVRARDRIAPGIPVITVVTDLGAGHAAWRYDGVDLIIAPPDADTAPAELPDTGPGPAAPPDTGPAAPPDTGPAAPPDTGPAAPPDAGPAAPPDAGAAAPPDAGRGLIAPPRARTGRSRANRTGAPVMMAGLPVTREFWAGPLRPTERALLRRSLGLPEGEFVVLLTGGGEGSGGIARRAAALLRFTDVNVVAVCGRNVRLRHRLSRLAARTGTHGRLTVTGFTHRISDWLHCADLVVTKAGPGTIAEAACCGAPLVLTSHLPGQEQGNTELVTVAGAGRRAAGVRQLIAEIGRLRDDQAGLASMRAASGELGCPRAAADIAGLIADLVAARPAEPATARPADDDRLTMSQLEAGHGAA